MENQTSTDYQRFTPIIASTAIKKHGVNQNKTQACLLVKEDYLLSVCSNFTSLLIQERTKIIS
jgi:hypothetical protein